MKIGTSFIELKSALQLIFCGFKKNRYNLYEYDMEITANEHGITLRNCHNDMEGQVPGDVYEEGSLIVFFFIFRDILKTFHKGSLFIHTAENDLIFQSQYARLNIKNEEIIRSDKFNYCFYKDNMDFISRQEKFIKRFDLGKKIFREIKEGDLVTFRSGDSRLMEDLPVVQKRWNSKELPFPFILYVWDGEDVISVPAWNVNYYKRLDIPWEIKQKFQL